jgi:hypothetical protein
MKWLLAIGGLALIIVFGAPFVIYWRTGQYPKGFFLQITPKNTSVPSANDSDQSPDYKRQDVTQLDRLDGFLPFYYEAASQPNLAQLKSWGANAVNIIVEDVNEYQQQHDWLVSEVVTLPSGAPDRLRDLGVPFGPDEGAPDRLDLEATVGELVTTAHELGLVVKLSIPFTKTWLTFAEINQVELVSTMNDEADGWLGDARNRVGAAAATEMFNSYAQALLARARQFYTGQVGVGFTNLLDRPSTAAAFFIDGVDITGFDFLTINPHADPSLRGEAYTDFVAKFSQTARQLAERSGIDRVYLAALMVPAASESVRGFNAEAGAQYSDAEEAALYQTLLDRTNSLLDGTFLQFSGWEDRPALQVIRESYQR